MVFNDMRFKQWKQRVEASGNIIKNVEVLSVISRDQKTLFIALLDCLLLTPEGLETPRYVIIRGESVVIIPVLTCEEDKEIYTMMVEQRRIADGDYNIEFAAGSANQVEGGLRAAACQEVKEELSISVSSEELVPLNNDSIKITPSLSDDMVYFFYFEREVSSAFLKEMDGLRTGCYEEKEDIRVKVYKMSEVANILSSSALIGIKLLEKSLGCHFK